MLKKEEAKTVSNAVNELSESYIDFANILKGTASTTRATRRSWGNERRSRLIETGLTLIALPDPLVTTVLGSAMVAAGVVQEGIRRQTLHASDVYKTFQNTMKELRNLKSEV